MSTATMMMQLGKGMISTAEIFFLTLLFPAAGTTGGLGQDV